MQQSALGQVHSELLSFLIWLPPIHSVGVAVVRSTGTKQRRSTTFFFFVKEARHFMKMSFSQNRAHQ